MGRAICLWKNYEKAAKLHAQKHMARIDKIEAEDEAPTTKPINTVDEGGTPHIQPENKAKKLVENCLYDTMLRPICKEYDEIVNHIVRTTEVHGKYDLDLQPSWHGYKKDPFDSTAKTFWRVLKDRMIEVRVLNIPVTIYEF